MKLKSLLTTLAAAVGLTTAAVGAGTADENGIVPYDWVTFDDLTVGDVTSGTKAANQGSNTTGMSLPAGSAVSVSESDKAWQFGTASSNPAFAPAASCRPTTYVTKLNLNGASYNNRNIWGVNGKLYGGQSLSVNGSGSSYTVIFGRADNGSVKQKYYEYSVPADKISGFHWYVMTVDSAGTTMHCYVDGVDVSGAISVGLTAGQNTNFGWGQLGNAGGSPATGLQVSDFRIYTQVLTASEIANIAGVSGTTYKATISGEKAWGEIVWDPALEGEPEALDVFEVTGSGTDALLTFGSAVSYGCTLALKGDAIKIKAADSFYEDGCWNKEFAKFGTLTCENEPTFADIKEGFNGAYAKTSSGFSLRGQNMEVISLNIGGGDDSAGTSPSANLVSGTGYVGLAPVQGNTWINQSDRWKGYATKNFPTIEATADGETKITKSGTSATCSAQNTYRWNDATDVFLKGYLDDGGNCAQVTVTGVPYSKYDVIVYCATDTGSRSFRAVTVNDTAYTYDSANPDTAKVGSDNWGASQNKTAVYGTNAIRVRNQTASTLTIVGGSNGNGARGGIAAVQIIEVSRVQKVNFTATITGDAALSTVTWSPEKTREFIDTDIITITNTAANATFTFDQDVTAAKFSVVSAVGTGVTLAKGDATLDIPTFDFTEATGAVTIDFDPSEAAIKAGTDTILNTIGTGMITIADGKKLTVTSGTLTDTQVSNSGTLNFAGGTEEEPINFTMSGSATKVTLGANTYVKATPNGNKVYNVTGTDETSVFEISRTDDGTGCSEGAKFRNLTLVANVTKSGKYFWLEHAPTDATVQLVSNGNGIYLNGSTTVGSLSGSGYIYKYDDSALTIAPAVDANFAGGAGVDITIANGTATQTFSGNYTGTLTLEADATVKLTGSVNPTIALSDASIVYVDPNGAAMTFTKAITGPAYNCSIRVEDTSGAKGSVAFSGDMTGFGGSIDYDNCSYDIGTARTPNIPTYVTISPAVDFVAKQTAAEYGQGLASAFTGFTGYIDWTIVLKSPDGTTIETLTIDEEGNATSTASGEIHIDGAATYADATFTNATSQTSGQAYVGTLSYKSLSGLGLQYDDPVTTNSTGTGAYLKHHPWITGLPNSFMQSEEMTIAVVGEMSPSNDTVFVHFGTTTGSNKGIYLATGSKEDEVVVKMNTGKVVSDITTMTVPHAATARHVYIITKKDVGDESTVSVYLDGTPWKTTKFSKISLTGGVQCGSDHGGELHRATPPVVNAVSSDDTALINVLRVYDRVISAAEIAAYSTTYPYVSDSGTSSRTFAEAAENWIGAEEATCWSFKQTATSEAVLTNAPVGSSSIEIKGTDEVTTTVTVNLDADEHSDSIKISSPGAFKFVKGVVDAQIISGQTTIGCPVEIEYGSLDISGAPLTLIDDGAVVFDVSGIDFTQYFSNATIPLTGDTAETDQITAKGLPEATATRTIEFGYNGTQYVLTITINTEIPFVYDSGDWTWNDESVTTEIVSNNTAMAIKVQSDLEWNIDRSAFTVAAGTLKATKAGTSTITVENDATFDVNGLGGSLYTVVLNGGSLVNNGTKVGDAAQTKALTLGDDSTVGGTGDFALQSQSYGPTTIDLGANTLTKTGDNTFSLVETTVEGTGTLYVEAGTVYSSEKTTFTNGTLKIGANGRFKHRESRTLTIATVVGEGGVFENNGTASGFALSGTLTLTGSGSYGTNTLANGASVNVGTKRGLTFAGEGTVNVTLTDAEIAAGAPLTVFTLGEGATTVMGTIMYGDKDITDKCTISGGTITAIDHEAKIGSTYYLTLAAALDAAAAEEEITLVKSVTFAPDGMYTIDKTIGLNLGGYNLTGNGGKTFEVVNNASFSITATDSTVAGVRINVGKAGNDNGALFITNGTWTITSNALVHVNGECKSCTVDIQGATMTSDGDNAIQFCGAGTFTINGGTITGATAVYAKAGTVSIAAALVANGAKADYQYSTNGANATGDALVIDNCGYPEGPAAVSILAGTTLTSANNAKMGYYVYNSSKEGTVTKDASIEVNVPAGYGWDYGTTLAKMLKYYATVYANGEPYTWAGLGTGDAFYAKGVVVDATTAGVTNIGGQVYYVSKLLRKGDPDDLVCEFEYDGTTLTKKDGATLDVTIEGTAISYEVTTGEPYTLDSLGHACIGGIYYTAYVAPSGPTPAAGSDTKVTPVAGEENTYKLEPTGTSTEVAVDNVKEGDTLVVDATVTAIGVQAGEQSGVIIKVRNSGDTAYIPNKAMYGWDGNSFGTALDPDGFVEIDGEEIPVTPEVDAAAETPVGVTDTQASVAMRTIPGLTYQLVRGTEPGVIETPLTTEGAVKTATGVATTLVDTAKPADKAFYKVQVTK